MESALTKLCAARQRVQRIVENDTKYTGASWAVLAARKSRITRYIEECIEENVAKRKGKESRDDRHDVHSNPVRIRNEASIGTLIHSDMNLWNLLEV